MPCFVCFICLHRENPVSKRLSMMAFGDTKGKSLLEGLNLENIPDGDEESVHYSEDSVQETED